MGNKRLMEYIASLSEEEREQHKVLIEETMRRDREIALAFSTLRANFDKLCRDLVHLMETSADLIGKLSVLNGKLTELRDTARSIPQVRNGGPGWN